MQRIGVRRRLSALLTSLMLASLLAALVPASSSPLLPEDAAAVGPPVYACASLFTGTLRHSPSGTCTPGNEVLVNLNGDPSVTVCASLYTGMLRYPFGGPCTSTERSLLLPGVQAVNLCANRSTGRLRYQPNGQCPAGEGLVLIPLANDPPTDIDLSGTTVEENAPAGTLIGTLTATDPDAGDTFTFSLLDDAGGRFQVVGDQLQVADGTLLDFETATSHSVTIQVADDSGATYSESFTIDVTDVNEAPIAVDNAYTTDEDVLLDSSTLGADQSVLDNDSDPEGDVLTVTEVDGSAANVGNPLTLTNGTLTMQANGTFVYAPNPDANGDPADTFTYQVCDPEPLCDTATVTITINAVDDPPAAVDDAATVAEDSGATTLDVLANDTDIDGGPISIQSVTQPANGAVAITNGGADLTYTPNPDYCNDGTPLDTFTYTLNGGSTATVSVTVSCLDDPPVAVDDAAAVTEDSGANAIDVLANDADPDGGPISIQSVTQPANGAVAITNMGADLTYAPDLDYCNDPPGMTLDTFTYTLNGGSTATVSVTVTCVDDDPVAVDDAATVAEDSGVNTIDVLANDTDVDGGPISIDSVTQPANGTVVITNGGADLTYAPNADYCNDGTPLDTFTYTLTPGGSTATVSVTVTCVDDNPVAVADSATVDEDSGANTISVLSNDTDVDGGPISIDAVTQPANGTVVITNGGADLTYAPNAEYCNDPPGTMPDTFTYTLTPGGSMATVSVTVTCVDDPPVAVDDAATVAEDSGANVIDVLANDTDIDGGPLTINAVQSPSDFGGTVLITGMGSGLTYQPAPDFCNNPPGTTLDTFTYTLNGGSTATVTVTVTCVNDAPVIDLDADDSGGTLGSDYAINYIENSGGVLIVDPADATITDVDSPTLVSLTVTITNLQDTGQEFLDANPAVAPNITGSYNPVTGVLTLSSVTPQPIADYQAILRTVTYEHSGQDPTGAPARLVTFVANDGTDDSNTATSTVTVVPVDDPPVALDDAATVDEDSGATTIDVMANDTDPDDTSANVIQLTSDPANGTVQITNMGADLTYTPDLNYCNDPPGGAPDTFTYTLSPGSSTATVSVTVTCVNDPPLAGDDSFDFIGNTELRVDTGASATPHALETTGTLNGALANDTEPEGDLFEVTSITVGACTDSTGPTFDCTDPTVGTVTMNADGTFSFVPAPGDLDATETFSYTITDNGQPAPESDTGTVTLTVSGASGTSTRWPVLMATAPRPCPSTRSTGSTAALTPTCLATTSSSTTARSRSAHRCCWKPAST